jgi:hypothetical protein
MAAASFMLVAAIAFANQPQFCKSLALLAASEYHTCEWFAKTTRFGGSPLDWNLQGTADRSSS